MRQPRKWGIALVLVSALLVVLWVGGSHVLAERTNVAPRDQHHTVTLVGVQGPAKGGNVSLYEKPGVIRWQYSGDAVSYQGVDRLGPEEVTALERSTGIELSNATVLATFADDGYTDCGRFESPCKRTGIRLIDPNPEAHVVYEWSYPVRTREDSEVHDAELLPSGELLVADMEYESVFTVDLSTGERTWTWNASSHYDAPPDPTREDWLHINDVDRIGPDRYLVSVRNTNQLVIVERGEGVVDIVNRDRDPTVLNRQHNPHWLGPGAVVVADSENDRVVELHENRTTGEWEVAWALTRTGGIYFDWPRDADRLPNGHTLITDSRNNRVVEVDRNGDLVASYATEPLPYEADRPPHDESAGRPYRPVATKRPVGSRSDVPLFSSLVDGARHVVGLPYWVSGVHLLVLTVAGVLFVLGVYLLLLDRSTDASRASR